MLFYILKGEVSAIKLYILKRLLILILLLFGITLLTFSLTKALPGDPVETQHGRRKGAA